MLAQNILAKIHIAAKALKLSDTIYRDILRANTGKESSKDLNPREAAKVLEHFKALGWVATRRMGGSRTAPTGPRFPVTLSTSKGRLRFNDLGVRIGMATPAQLRKIEAMWMTGTNIREKTDQALRHFLKNKFSVSDLRFIEQWQVRRIISTIEGMTGHET